MTNCMLIEITDGPAAACSAWQSCFRVWGWVNVEFSIHADLIFLESSSLTGEGVDEGFMQCAKKIMTGIDSGVHSPWLST